MRWGFDRRKKRISSQDKKCIRRNPSLNYGSNAFVDPHHHLNSYINLSCISSNTQPTLHTHLNSKMKSANWRLLLLLLFFTSSTSSAWFGTKHKSSGASSSSSGRFRSDEASSSSSFSPPFLLNRFRSGSAVVFPVHGNVYPVGYVKGQMFLFSQSFLSVMPFFLLSVFFILFPASTLFLFVLFILGKSTHYVETSPNYNTYQSL